MRYAVLAWLVLAGCGRLGFERGDVAGDAGGEDGAGPTGHDEDADGVADAVDDCPHLAGPQLDGDGDGVGDACDPEPSVPRQRLLRFATLRNQDQPFAVGEGQWTQRDDELAFDGQGHGDVALPDLPLASFRARIGFSIEAVTTATQQRQFAIGTTAVPVHFVELNEVPGMFKLAAVTRWDGTTYAQIAQVDLTDGIHPGEGFLQITMELGVSTVLDGGWSGESYHVPVADADTVPGTLLVNTNFLAIALRYVWIIAID